MLNGFETFLICVSVISVSVHSWFPLLMSPPDSDVAGKRIEPHITGSHQGAVAWKRAHTVCFPSSGCSEGTKLATRHQQNHFFVLYWCLETLVSPLFSSLSHGGKLCGDLMQGILTVLKTLPLTCVSAQTSTRIIGQGTASPAGIPSQPLGHWLNSWQTPSIARICTSQQHALQKLSSLSSVTHFFSVP